jgi:hypothetical protein
MNPYRNGVALGGSWTFGARHIQSQALELVHFILMFRRERLLREGHANDHPRERSQWPEYILS